MTDAEVWKPVVGQESSYEVSDLGRVRSLDRVIVYQRKAGDLTITVERRYAGRILRPGLSGGHLTVALGREVGSKSVHRLVLESFVGPCPEGMECCHEDDDGCNNRLTNLSWGTRSNNLFDAVRNKRKPVGEAVAWAKLTETGVRNIRKELAAGTPIIRLAERFGVHRGTIQQIRDGRSWKGCAA